MTHIQFEMMDPRLIEPSPWNANSVSHENEEKLRASIGRLGMFKPILVRELSPGAYECLGGWHRCEQAIELGYTEVPVANLGGVSDEKAKEISLADNARYGIDDALKLSEILGDLDVNAIEAIMPWTSRDIAALTASLNVDIDDLDLDEPTIDDEGDEPEESPEPKTVRTHQNLRFRCSIPDAAKISELINKTMQEQGFTKEDALTNAGDALAFILSAAPEDDSDV